MVTAAEDDVVVATWSMPEVPSRKMATGMYAGSNVALEARTTENEGIGRS
jgi:hypothetical protein